MLQKKVIFIIPGFRQLSTNKAYKEIAKILRKEGYFPILVAIKWKNSTILQNTEYFLKVYKKIKHRKKYILGFSYGAMIAFIASTKVSVSGLILCSLSPYFQEDVIKIKNRNAFSVLMEARFKDFSKLHSGMLAEKIKAKKVLMLYGREETRILIKRVKETFGKVLSSQKHLISIKKTQHNIGDRRYLNQITNVARNFL